MFIQVTGWLELRQKFDISLFDDANARNIVWFARQTSRNSYNPAGPNSFLYLLERLIFVVSSVLISCDA